MIDEQIFLPKRAKVQDFNQNLGYWYFPGTTPGQYLRREAGPFQHLSWPAIFDTYMPLATGHRSA